MLFGSESFANSSVKRHFCFVGCFMWVCYSVSHLEEETHVEGEDGVSPRMFRHVGTCCLHRQGGLKAFESRVLWIFGPERNEATGDWRKFHSEKLHNFCSSYDIVLGLVIESE